ncbi:MAG: hypothetical protein RMY28_009580 [Nostoc sp. ChiSLP01]|nr:hypothetical protein [Nostoc sp. CmiSLP01]MDZ8285194.1 hypothetical protein [Nostoc sp. ChiSLP01]
MAVVLFTMRDVEERYANFAEIGAGRRRTRGTSQVAAAVDPFASAPAPKPSKYRPNSAAVADPFATAPKQSVTQQIKQAAKDAPTYLRKTKRGGVAIVKKGLRQAKRAIKKVTSAGVRAGAANISTGTRQIAGDVAVASRRAGRGVLGHLGANKGKYALAGAALGGAGYLLTRPKQQEYSRRPTSIYFSRR